MRICNARVIGFGSFADTGEIELSGGFNLIIGQNNAGKSDFLRALQPDWPDRRHRSKDAWQDHELKLPELRLKIALSGSELKDAVQRMGDQQIHVPIDRSFENNLNDAVNSLFECDRILIETKRAPSNQFELIEFPSHGCFNPTPGQEISAVIQSRNGILSITGPQYGANDSLPSVIWNKWHRDLFYFSAQRSAAGRGPFGEVDRLVPNAANLPAALHTLANKRGTIFERLVDHMREIFPTIGNVSVPPRGGSEVEICLWATEDMTQPEQSFSLDTSGTGIGQVLAMLVAIMTAEKAIIVIDEINTFLHPSAVKAFLRILQSDYSEHQYIVSTHAPEVIGFSNPATVYLVKRAGFESTMERLDLTSVTQLRSIAGHLGVSMADVFAADQVLWVEGQTEELCFPYLYRELVGQIPKGTVFTTVAATGDFNQRGKRSRKLVYDVYEQLSTAVASLPVAIAFSFDMEKLSVTEMEGMITESKGRIHFLPRRHLECFFVNPDAIAAFIAEHEPSDSPITASDVESALKSHAAENGLNINQWKGDLFDENWLAKVDAARLIVRTVTTLTENRVTFSKMADSLFLARHIIEHDRTSLGQLGQYLKDLVAAPF